jgi:hypothetical protein
MEISGMSSDVFLAAAWPLHYSPSLSLLQSSSLGIVAPSRS